MNREDKLALLVSKVNEWPKPSFNGTGNIFDWSFQDDKYIHPDYDYVPITIDDWNRAKIVPNTKVRILSPEHESYIKTILDIDTFFVFIDVYEGYEDKLFMYIDCLDCSLDCLESSLAKEIFIELPIPNINARVLAEKVGAKHDQGKPRYDLIPVHAEAEFVDVLTFGATKYAPNQWRNVEGARERYTAAAMRHIAAYRMGETHDQESGKHHLAHAMCCMAFIIELDLEKE